MNDDLTGQLTDEWLIPEYAQKLLWLDSDASSAQCEGQNGLFELDAPAQILTLRWGSMDGAPLTQLRWQIDNLQWDGSVRVGGMVEAIHVKEYEQLDFPISIVYFSAQALKPHAMPYPDASQRTLTSFPVPFYEDDVEVDDEPSIITLIVPTDSHLAGAAQDSLMNKSPMHVYAHLATEDEGWHHFFAQPIIWDAVTLFTP